MLALLFFACLAFLSGLRADEPAPNEAARLELLKSRIENMDHAMAGNMTSLMQSDTVAQLLHVLADHSDQIQQLHDEVNQLHESIYLGFLSRKEMLEYHDEPAPNEAARLELLESRIENMERAMAGNMTSLMQSDTVAQLQHVLADHSDQIQQLHDEVNQLHESIYLGFLSRKKMLEYHDKCAFSYKGYCYFGYFSLNQINQDGARMACKQRGAVLADIYSEEHYKLVVNYLRGFLPGSTETEGSVRARTGMTFQPTTGLVFLSDGEAAPFIEWYPGFPKYMGGYTTIIFSVRSVQLDNGMYDETMYYESDAALCQVKI